MFEVVPAIDLEAGRCVRLTQGDFARATVFDEDPVAVARRWVAAGATRIHVVDLDGARAGRPVQHEVVRTITGAVEAPVQLGGGLRTAADLEAVFAAGVHRAVLGTAALEDTALLDAAIERYEEHLAVGIDARDGRVAVRGWLDVSDQDALTFARALAGRGVRTIITTNIARDGMLGGPDVAGVAAMVEAVPGVEVVASGGVGSLADLVELSRTGARAAIVGKALYTGAVDLRAAIAAVSPGSTVGRGAAC